MDGATAERVAAAFALGHPAEPPSYVQRGAMGEIWRLATDRGAWAVKRLFPWADYPADPFDVTVQRVASDRGLPLPAPVVTESGAVIAVGDHRFRVYEWVDLVPPLNPPIAPERTSEAGALLGRIHALGLAPPDEPIDAWYVETHGDDEWRELAARARDAGAPWAEALQERLPLMSHLRRRVEGPSGRPHLCHRDFGPDNVIPRASDGALVVLDWENVGPLPAEQELASAFENWTTHDGRVDQNGARRFFTAYRDEGGPAGVRDASAFSAAVCALLNFLHVLAEQALDDPEHRSFAEPGVAEILDLRLTNLAAAIDGLVAFDLV